MSLSDIYVNKDLINTYLPPHLHRNENIQGGKLGKIEIDDELKKFLPPRVPRTQPQLERYFKEYLREAQGLAQLTQRMAEVIQLDRNGAFATRTFREIAETFRGLRLLYN